MLRLNETQWQIIKELSRGNITPSKLAKKLGISLPTIHKDLAELSRQGIVKKVGKLKGKTRPYFEYSLKDFVYFIKALKRETAQRFLSIDENLKIHLRIWSIPQQKFHIYIEELWWLLKPYLEFIESFAVFDSVAKGEAREESDIDVLILAKTKIKQLEKKFSAITVGPKKKEKIVMAKIFKPEDFKKSLKKDSKFAKEILKHIIIVFDPSNFLSKLKNEFAR